MIAATQSVAPGKITEDHARQLLQDAAAWQPRGVRTLHRYLERHPRCLSSPDPYAPITAVRLAYGLHAAGCRVELPACARCGKRWPRLIRLAPEGRCCEWCVTKANTVTCGRCGKTGYPTAVRPDGTICRTCYLQEPHRAEKCVRCGRLRAPSTRDDSGDPLCGTCARPQHICTQCGRKAIAKKFSETGPLCARCYEPPRRPCGGCGRIVAIANRRGGEHPDLCKRCRPERTHRCVVCSRVRPAKAIWPKGPVCRACYRQALIHPDPCATCSRIGVLTGIDLTGRAVCGPCAGSSIDYRCTTCDQPGLQHYAGTCLRCSVRRRAATLLADEHGYICSQILPFIVYLAAEERRPDSTLRWLDHPKTIALLQHIARVEHPIVHADLDALPPSTALHYLRAVLVHVDVLPPRIEPLGRLEQWLHHLTGTLTAEHAALIRPYAQWSVLRRARRRAVRRSYTDSSAQSDRAIIWGAVHLLEWLDENDLAITDLNQHQLDRWTSVNGHRTYRITGFVLWLRQRDIIGDAAVSRRQSAFPTDVAEAHQHARRIRRLLTDATIELPLRVAGLLVLLYGIPLTRILALSTSAVEQQDGETNIVFARNPVRLPPTVATLVNELVETAIVHPLATKTGSPFLFPSRTVPGTARHARPVGVAMTDLDIPVRISRNSALRILTEDLPAPVVADLLGLHIHSVSRWADYARRDWAHYLDARSNPDQRQLDDH